MIRRRNLLSSLVLLLAAPLIASADDYDTGLSIRSDAPSHDSRFTLDVSFSLDDVPAPHYDWVSQVTMPHYAAGSLHYEFAGFERFVVRHMRSQYRSFVRKAVRKGWYVRPEDDDISPLFNNRAERDFVGGFNNGAWWLRSWTESLPPEKGGTPYSPHVRVIGSDAEWSAGPLTITNQFNVRFDYIAFFELNPNPVETQGGKPERRASLDIRPPADTSIRGTNVSFDIKPRVRVGMPKDGTVRSLLRELSLRGSMEIRHQGAKLIEGEVEIAWDPDDGFEVTFEVSLVNW